MQIYKLKIKSIIFTLIKKICSTKSAQVKKLSQLLNRSTVTKEKDESLFPVHALPSAWK